MKKRRAKSIKRPTVVELAELRKRLREAEDTLSAIRKGEVDALIVNGPDGDQVFSLKGAEQPYRVFVERMQQGALTLTRDGTILYCNSRFANLVGTPLQRVIGSQFLSFTCAEDNAVIIDLLQSPDQRTVQTSLRTPDGNALLVTLSASSLVLDEMDAVCMVVTDLTEREAKLAAEQANRTKDEFLAALSHELRTPLTPVLMTIASLETDDRLPEDVLESIVGLRRSVELEARLIDDLLDLTRIAKGKIELHTKLINVVELVKVVLTMCELDIRQKNLQLRFKAEADCAMVEADSMRVQQIIWNIVRNAIKFTPEGGQIVITSRISDSTVEIEVTDTGIGIEADSLSRIFMPFEQANRLVTRRFGGLGLGLAISNRLAGLLGGAITVESPGANQGATFVLKLPLAVGDARSARAAESLANESRRFEIDKPALQPLRVLLVEDHAETASVLGRLLGRMGHEVKVASNIATALDLAASATFDVVVSDIGLPDGTGHDLMRHIKQNYQIPGVALTGYGMEDDVARSRDAGFVAHVVKPVNLDHLQSVIGKAARRN